MPVNETRLDVLERRIGVLEVAQAVQSERDRTIIKRLDKIDGHVSKLVWLIVAAIVTGFMTFLVNGGLHG